MEISSWRKRGLCLALTTGMAAGSVMSAFAQAGQPGCDEAMYVTMDPYGTATDVSVVKSYDLHGAKQVVDYGTYLEVNNMTDYVIPQINDKELVFDLSEDPEIDRFYFEGKMEPAQAQKELPWNLTVSYRLNGVERTLEELAHEKGLVEITIDVMPNAHASDYYKNNMTLEATAVVDMEKNLSVEAEGAQIQSLGNLKAVLFMALPGEEQHFKLMIGTEDFEFQGMMFLMVPVTLSQLDDLETLREAKDTVKDSADAISDSLEIFLDSLDGIEEGLAKTVEGLDSLNESRKVISRKKESLYVDADEALAVLKELSGRGVPFTGYMKEVQDALADANEDINNLTDLVADLDTDLEDLKIGLSDVQDDLKDTEKALRNGRDDLRAWEGRLEKLKKDLDVLKTKKDEVTKKISQMQSSFKDVEDLKELIQNHEDVLGISPEEIQRLLEQLESITGGRLPSEEEWNQLIASASNALGKIEDEIPWEKIPELPDMGLDEAVEHLKQLVGQIGQAGNLDEMIREIQKGIDSIESMIYHVRRSGEGLVEVMADSGNLIETLKGSTEKGQEFIDQISAIRSTVNKYHQTAIEAAGDMGLLIDSAIKGADAMYLLMSDVENTLKQAGEPLDQGTKGTIEGLSDALNHAIDGLSKTATIRDAKTTVEDLIEEKWDEYTGEKMNLLNADSNARKTSFTSSRNPEPESLQIILRTQGTEEIEEEEEIPVDESFHAQGNFFQRIWNILKEIVNVISSAFN